MEALACAQPEVCVADGTVFRLRPVRDGDQKALVKYASARGVAELTATLPHPYEESHADSFVERALKTDWSTSATMAIESGGELVGVIGAVAGSMPPLAHDWVIGYWLGEPFWGRGIMSAALEGFVDMMFLGSPGVLRLHLEALAQNGASQRVATKAGFVKEGVHRGAFVPRFETAPSDVVCFGLLRHEWSARRPDLQL